MDIKKRALSRVSIWVDEERKPNNEPLHSRVSIYSDFPIEEKFDKYTDLLQTRRATRGGVSITAINNGPAPSIDSVFSRNSGYSLLKLVSARHVRYAASFDSFFNCMQLLQLITQQTVDQLAIIVGRQSSHKHKLYLYKTPEERFNQKPVYTLEVDTPTKTMEQKLLKIQGMIKKKIDELIIYLHNILRDTSDEMRVDRRYTTLYTALENIYTTQYDNFEVLNTKPEETHKSLIHDIKRIEKETDRLMEGNRAIGFGYLTAKDQILFLNMKKKDYIEKWEASRQWLNDYNHSKACNDVGTYIRNIHDKILKDQDVTFQLTKFLNMDIMELERKRDEYPEKLDVEVERRTRIIANLKEELEKMKIKRIELAAEIKLRTQKMKDWLIYREKKEAEDAELARIAEEEEAARIEEEERIAAELAAEEEFLATLTMKEKDLYLKDKKKKERKAAKAAKKAAKVAARKARRKA